MTKPVADSFKEIAEGLKKLDRERWERIGGTPEPFPSKNKKKEEEEAKPETEDDEPSMFIGYIPYEF